MTRTPTVTAYSIAAIAPSTEPEPPAFRNLMATIFACQFKPTVPMPLLPRAAIVPDTWVP